jgi:hypothetical protein
MTSNLKNISRVETGQTIGWQVRFRRQGERYSKFFSDKKHDGTDGAREAAIAWRDETKGTLPERGNASETRGKRSETGVRGLSIGFHDVGNGTRNPYVQVSFYSDGDRNSSSFSVEKWGLRRAVWKGCRRLGKWRDWPMQEMQEHFETAMRNIDPEKYEHPPDDAKEPATV